MTKLVLAGLLGFTAAAAWNFGISVVLYRAYTAIGSPLHPSPFLWFPSVVGLSFLFGAVGALPLYFVYRPRAAGAFLFAALLLVIGVTTYFSGVHGVVAQLSSYGFWGFVLGMLFAIRLIAAQQGAPVDRPASRAVA